MSKIHKLKKPEKLGFFLSQDTILLMEELKTDLSYQRDSLSEILHNHFANKKSIWSRFGINPIKLCK